MKKNISNSIFLVLFTLMYFQLSAQIRGNAEPDRNVQTDRVFQALMQNPAQAPGARSLFQQQGNLFTLETHVKINVTPDYYIVHLSVHESANTVDKAMSQMDERISKYKRSLQQIGIPAKDVLVDFIQAQRVYGFAEPQTGNIIQEELQGFEVKKNVIFKLKNMDQFDACLRAAAAVEIFDLIKVDYVVEDRQQHQQKALQMAMESLEKKKELVKTIANKENLGGREILEVVFNEFQPLQSYRQYTVQSTQSIDHAHLSSIYRQRNYHIIHANKPSTWYYDAQDTHQFDKIEDGFTGKPAVQITVFVKARYVGI